MTKNVSKYYNNFNNFIKIGKVEVKYIETARRYEICKIAKSKQYKIS